MSRSIGKQKLLKEIAKRHYSAQAAVKPCAGDHKIDVTTKRIKVVTCNVNSPLAKISFSFRAGSRYETPANYGLCHILRRAVGLSTTEVFPFNITRTAQQYGMQLYASSDRETYTVTVEAHPSAIQGAFYYASNIATHPAFKPWEIADNRERVKLDLQVIPPEAKTLELLHAVAYRHGLGNPIFVDPSRISKISNVDLTDYYIEHCTAPRLQITTSGVDPELLNQLLPSVEPETGNGPKDEKPTYYGGENRIFNGKEYNAYIAVAGETPGYTQKEYLPYAVLKYIYGNPPPAKYGSGQGILNKAFSNTGILGAVSGFNTTYSDSGLVGFFLAAEADGAHKAFEAVVSAMLKADINDKDVARGKALLKLSIAESMEGGNMVDFFSKQAGLDNLITPQQVLSAIDSVKTADVKQAAQKIANGKLSVAMYGNTIQVPYIDTIKK